jgi:hypothetical protein
VHDEREPVGRPGSQELEPPAVRHRNQLALGHVPTLTASPADDLLWIVGRRDPVRNKAEFGGG